MSAFCICNECVFITKLGGTAELAFRPLGMEGFFVVNKMKGGSFMIFGIPDISISGALVLTFLSMVGCVVYGIINWNKG